MSPTSEALADVRHRMDHSVAYVGPFEAVYEAIFGPFDHDQHVEAYRNHLWITERRASYQRADAFLRAYLAEQGVKTC